MTEIEKHISKIIYRHVDWMIGWSVDEETKQKNINCAAKKITKYLKGVTYRNKEKAFQNELKNEWKDR